MNLDYLQNLMKMDADEAGGDSVERVSILFNHTF